MKELSLTVSSKRTSSSIQHLTCYLKRAEKVFRERVLAVYDRRSFDPFLAGAMTAFSRATARLEVENGEQAVRIHRGKFSLPLLRDLLIGKFARASGDWIKLTNEFGAKYMMCLGVAMSEAMQIPLVTDDREYEDAGEYIALGTMPAQTIRPAGHPEGWWLTLIRIIARGDVPVRMALGEMKKRRTNQPNPGRTAQKVGCSA